MKDLSRSAHVTLTSEGDRRSVEALRSLYERVELRLWNLLPRRIRRRLTTYGIADLIARPPLESRDSAGITVRELLDPSSAGAGGEARPDGQARRGRLSSNA
jgi:hypothetical protein